MRLVEQSSFDELTLELNGLKLTLRRGAVAEQSNGGFAFEQTAGVGAPAPNSAIGTIAAPAALRAANSLTGSACERAMASSSRAVPLAGADPNVQNVISPMLGTFYRAPKPGAPPFVEIGSIVEEDTIVALIEVMKLMNSVRAGVRGTVSEILARDGALVEYGETVLRVRKTS
jgi:acetyl-CoA carboxylase biotin carboxyl carrier protein